MASRSVTQTDPAQRLPFPYAAVDAESEGAMAARQIKALETIWADYQGHSGSAYTEPEARLVREATRHGKTLRDNTIPASSRREAALRARGRDAEADGECAMRAGLEDQLRVLTGRLEQLEKEMLARVLRADAPAPTRRTAHPPAPTIPVLSPPALSASGRSDSTESLSGTPLPDLACEPRGGRGRRAQPATPQPATPQPETQRPAEQANSRSSWV